MLCSFNHLVNANIKGTLIWSVAVFLYCHEDLFAFTVNDKEDIHEVGCLAWLHAASLCSVLQGLFPPGQGATIGVDFMIKTVEIKGEKVKVCKSFYLGSFFSCDLIHNMSPSCE